MYVWTTLALERYKKEEEEFEASLGYMSPCIKREGKKKKEKEVEEERSVEHYFLVNLGGARSSKWGVRRCTREGN